MLKTFLEYIGFTINKVNESTDKTGTYCGARFGKNSQERLAKFAEDIDVPNVIPMNKFHVTILYSRKFLPNFRPEGYYKNPYSAQVESLEIWPSQGGKNCLVLKLDCDGLIKRHKYLMKEHGATFDYPEYKPHVTLSYDIGDMSIEDIEIPKFHLYLEREYKEDLDLDWADKNTKK